MELERAFALECAIELAFDLTLLFKKITFELALECGFGKAFRFALISGAQLQSFTTAVTNFMFRPHGRLALANVGCSPACLPLSRPFRASLQISCAQFLASRVPTRQDCALVRRGEAAAITPSLY